MVRKNDTEGALVRREDSLTDFWSAPARSLFREFDELRRSVDRLFGGLGVLSGPLFESPVFDAGFGAVDIYETGEDVRISVELPGVEQKDVQISVTGDTLTISGERAAEEEKEEGRYHIRQSARGAFRRSFRLPAEVDADKAKAVMKNGVLKVTLPKTQVAKTRNIKVESA
ncbi:MAG: Hsp20/alpha crystallin family protein [Armatimonadota bacterium]|jgi:HSP20 family protein|nr:MAG: molecular chaperone Hsp20 [Armatimonadota bacterium]